ncbi:MAG: hypothetical protein DRJ65_07030 [Acidobacteria bacterium]|nr:MAG: hypothetical protein DRJ65_07030 [Acidobacteriota bacterium]
MHQPKALTCSLQWIVTFTLVVAAFILVACGQTPSSGSNTISEAWFEDVISTSGVNFKHTTGFDGNYWFPEISAGGGCLLDYDGDGFLDLYLVQSGTLVPEGTENPPNQLYRNRGDWTFENMTVPAGVGDTGYGSGCGASDYDSDGDIDLYVTNLGPDVLYRNNGDGTFSDVTAEAGIANNAWGTSCTFADFDSDGHLDIFVANYVNWTPANEIECFSTTRRDYCSPKNYRAPARDVLFKNNGDGTFTDATVDAGIGWAFGNGFGIAHGDFDLDSDLDFYVSNDGAANQLWINSGDGNFTDQSMLAGCALNSDGWAEAGMGVAAADPDNDGDLDLFMCHIQEETNTFYVNENGSFIDSTAMTGLAAPSRGYTGFGMGFGDFNNDGRLDLYIANGAVKLRPEELDPDDPYAEPNHLFRGSGDGRFDEVEPRGGTAEALIATSRAASFGDLDNDGDIDILVVNKDAPPYLLRNRVGESNNWIMFRVYDADGNEAIGTILRVESGETTQYRQVQRTYSYCASNDPRVHFGLGANTKIERLTVAWMGGEEEVFGPFTAGQSYNIRRGEGSGEVPAEIPGG